MECSELEKPLKKAKLKKKCSSDRQKSNETVSEVLETSSENADSLVNEQECTLHNICLNIVDEIVENCLLNVKDPLEKGLELEDGAATINIDAVDIDISEVAVNGTCTKTAEAVHEGFETNKIEESIEVSTNSAGQIEPCKEVELLKEGEDSKNTKPTDLTNGKTNNDNNNNGCKLRSLETKTEDAIPIMNSSIPTPMIPKEEEPNIKSEFLSNVDTFGKVCLNPPKLSLVDYPEYDSFMETFPVQEYEKGLHALPTKKIGENSNNAVSESLADCCLNFPAAILYYEAAVVGQDDPSSTLIAFGYMYSLSKNEQIRRYLENNNVRFYEITWPQSASGSERILQYLETKPFLIEQAVYKAGCCLVYKNEHCMKLHASEFKTFSQITCSTDTNKDTSTKSTCDYESYSIEDIRGCKIYDEINKVKKKNEALLGPSSSKESLIEIPSSLSFPASSDATTSNYSKMKLKSKEHDWNEKDFFAKEQPFHLFQPTGNPINEFYLPNRKDTYRAFYTSRRDGQSLRSIRNDDKIERAILGLKVGELQNGFPKSSIDSFEIFKSNEQKNSKWTRFKNLFRKKTAADPLRMAALKNYQDKNFPIRRPARKRRAAFPNLPP